MVRLPFTRPSKRPPAPLSPLDRAARVREVLQAHMTWKRGLERVVREAPRDLTVESIRRCINLCPLGYWIYRLADESFTELPQFQALSDAHAEYQAGTSCVLRLLASGRQAEALAHLRSGAHARQAIRLKRLLIELESTFLQKHAA